MLRYYEKWGNLKGLQYSSTVLARQSRVPPSGERAKKQTKGSTLVDK